MRSADQTPSVLLKGGLQPVWLHYTAPCGASNSAVALSQVHIAVGPLAS